MLFLWVDSRVRRRRLSHAKIVTDNVTRGKCLRAQEQLELGQISRVPSNPLYHLSMCEDHPLDKDEETYAWCTLPKMSIHLVCLAASPESATSLHNKRHVRETWSAFIGGHIGHEEQASLPHYIPSTIVAYFHIESCDEPTLVPTCSWVDLPSLGLEPGKPHLLLSAIIFPSAVQVRCFFFFFF